MTVATTSLLAGPYTGNGSSAALPFAFPCFAATDLLVMRDGAALAYGGDYTVTLSTDQDNAPGGTVNVTASANTTGSQFYVLSNVSYQQPTSLPSQSRWSPKSVELALDRLALLAKQLAYGVSRAAMVPIGEAMGLLPSRANRAGKFFVFDANGDPAATASSSGADAALRTDLAASGGVGLVGGAAKSDFSNVTGANRLLTDDNIFSPVGNGASTRGRFNLLAQTSHNDIREMMFCLGANFTNGTAGSTSPSEKVVLYLGANMQPGSFKGWALNPLLHIEPGVAVEYANTVEIDIDNYSNGDFGAGIGLAGLSGAAVWGLTINGANPSSNTVTGGIALISSATGPIYERGYVVGPNSTKQAGFDDYSSATYSLRDLGSHTVGVELRGTYSLAAIRIPNNSSVIARNATNTGDVALIRADTTNQVVIGDGAGGNIVLANHVLPETDSTRTFGSSAKKFAEVHAQRLVLYPPGSVTPLTNGELRVEATSNTVLTFRFKGSDGTVRSGTITLS